MIMEKNIEKDLASTDSYNENQVENKVTDPDPSELSRKEESNDYFETRLDSPQISTENLFEVYGPKSFSKFKSADDYWNTDYIQKKFTDTYGVEGRYQFEKAYNNSKKEFSNFKLGNYKRSMSGYDFISNDFSDLTSTISTRYNNKLGNVKIGTEWSAPTTDEREINTRIRYKVINEEGIEEFKIEDYSVELLEKLEEKAGFGGLAYSDAFRGIDPTKGIDGLYYNAIFDGKAHNEITNKWEDVRNDQVVSRWDIDTGLGMFEGLLKNNKLEADGVFDYAKILVKAPMNTAINLFDTVVQLFRAGTAFSYGVTNMFRGDDKLALDSSEFYKYFTTLGIKAKSYNTSMSREAMDDGFFGSFEAFLTTAADVTLQVALAGGLGRAGAGLAGIMHRKSSKLVLEQAQQKAAEMFVRGTLTAMASKDSYNEALENGYTTTEASIITGAMAAALWKATKYASYLFGNYEIKVINDQIKDAVKNTQKGFLEDVLKKITVKNLAANKPVDAGKGIAAINFATRTIDKIFGKVPKFLDSKKWLHAAKQEGLEEMTEELFQDGVKQGASAYGVLMNNAKNAREGRYLTIFDEGYFIEAAERYATSGVAGSIGGIAGKGMHYKMELNPITSTSSLAEIVLAGHSNKLVTLLKEMKGAGEMGPTDLSINYNRELGAFEPILEGSDTESLSDMVFNTYLHDINAVHTFINQGMMGKARQAIDDNLDVMKQLNDNTMLKDLASSMGELINFHSLKGISTGIYTELDALNDTELAKRIPTIISDIKGESGRLQIELDELIASKEIPDNNESKKQKVTKKDKSEDAVESKATKIERLKAEIALSNTVSENDLKQLLNSYRKIRGIATGATAEHYLLQNENMNDPIIGSIYNRKEEYKFLGDQPFKDQLFNMRVRAIKDEKIHVLKEKVSEEVEKKVLSHKNLEDDSIDELLKLSVENKGSLTEKALKHIIKLRDKSNFKEANEQFDIKNEESIFKRNEDGTVSEKDIDEVFAGIMSYSKENWELLKDPNFLLWVKSSGQAKKFFAKAAKGVNKINSPVFDMDVDEDSGMPSYLVKPATYGKDFITDTESVLEGDLKTTNTERISEAFSLVGQETLKFRKGTTNAVFSLGINDFYISNDFNRRSVNAILNDSIGASYTGETLLDRGLYQVTDLLANHDSGKFYKHDASEINDVLSKIQIRKAIAKALVGKVGAGAEFTHLITMLASFRRNTLDIIDFKYEPNSIADTRIEDHPYKDYSVASDFFTDFLFDPLLVFNSTQIDSKLHLDYHKKAIKEFREALYLLADVEYKDGELYSFDMDEIALENFLNAEFENLDSSLHIEAAATFFKNETEFIKVPGNIIKGGDANVEITIGFKGIARLKMAEWLLNKTKAIIDTVDKNTGSVPYNDQKDRDIVETFKTFRDFIENDELGVVYDYIIQKVPGYELIISEVNPNKMEVGKMNIKIEKAIYDLYNSEKQLFIVNEVDIKTRIDDYIKGNLNANYLDSLVSTDPNVDQYNPARRLSIIVGAISTDFTSHYKKLKGIIKNTGIEAEDKIVTADQEFSAKYTAAYMTSRLFRSKVTELTNLRTKYTSGAIEAIYISGTAGSGKTTAVTNLGLKIGVNILNDREIFNTDIIPVSNHEEQVKNLANNIGTLAKNQKGHNIEELIKLLRKAVIEDDEKALKQLSTVGAIVIDEVTYVAASTIGKNAETAPPLQEINDLIKKVNLKNSSNEHPIVLIIMGDPKQTGSSEVSKGGYLFFSAIKKAATHYLPYMDFSFRTSNSFLKSSIDVINDSIDSFVRGYSKGVFQMFINKGTKYGTSEGKLYGLNISDVKDKNSSALISEEYINLLNDGQLAANIEANIIKAEKEKKEGKKGAFKVLIAPENKDEFINSSTIGSTKIGLLMNNPEYKDYFTLIKSSKVGGAEANYVIAEFPKQITADTPANNILINTSKNFNTLVTRAIDYIAVINRDPSVIIKESNKSKEFPNGTVLIPNNEIQTSVKKIIKQRYLDIFADIKEDEVTNETEEEVEIKGEIITPVKDNIKERSVMIKHFSTSKNGILNPLNILDKSYRGKGSEGKEGTELNKLVRLLENLQVLYLSGEESNTDLQDIINNAITEYENAGGIFIEELNNLYSFIDNSLIDNNTTLNPLLDFAITSYSNTKELLQPISTESDEVFTLFDVIKSVTNSLLDPDNKSIEKRDAILVAQDVSKDTFIEKRDLLLNSLLDTKLEDIMNESNEIKDLFNNLINSLLQFKFNTLDGKVPLSKPELDTSVVLGELAAFKTAVYNSNTSQLEGLLKQFKLANDDDIAVPGVANIITKLLDTYSRSSVYKALSDIVIIVKKQQAKVAKEKADAKLEEEKGKKPVDDTSIKYNKLKNKLGIDTSIKSKQKVYDEILKLDYALQQKIALGKGDEMLSEINDLMTFKELWHTLFDTYTTSFSTDVYGAGFYNRSLDSKETLDDYIKQEDSIRGVDEMYSIPVRKHNIEDITYLQEKGLIDKSYIILSEKEALNKGFNFSGEETQTLPDSLEILVTYKNYRNHLNGLLVAVRGDEKFIISQVDTSMYNSPEGNNSESVKLGASKLAAFIMKLEKVVKHETAFKSSEYSIITIPLKGDIKNLVRSRAGKILPSDRGTLGKSVNKLIEEGVNIADVTFAFTEKDDTKGSSISNKDIGNVRGELFTFYSLDNNSPIDVKKVTNATKGGVKLGDNRHIINEGTGINVQLGLLPLKIANDMVMLADVLSNHPTILIGEHPSRFSMALQTYIIEYVKNIAIGSEVSSDNSSFKNEIKLSIGGRKNILFTPKHLSIFTEMEDSLESYYSAKNINNNGQGDSIRKETKKALDKMKGDNTLHMLDSLAVGYIHSIITPKESNIEASHLLRKYSTGVYTFNINKFLKVANTKTLEYLTELADLASYSIKPSVEAGQNMYSSTVNKGFIDAIKPLLYTRIEGVEAPGIVITSGGMGAFDRAVEALDIVEITDEYKNRLVEALNVADSYVSQNNDFNEAVKVSNKVISLTKQEKQEDIKLLEEAKALFADNEVYISEVAKIDRAIRVINSWVGIENEIAAQGGTETATDVLLPQFINDDNFNPENKKEFLEVLNTILTSIVVDYSVTGNNFTDADKIVWEATKMDALVILAYADVPLEGQTPEEYAEDLVDKIKRSVDPQNNNGMTTALERCSL